MVRPADLHVWVEAMGLEPTNLLTASQALYQLSYAPEWQRNYHLPGQSGVRRSQRASRTFWPSVARSVGQPPRRRVATDRGQRELRNRTDCGHDVVRRARGHYPRRICHLTGPASIRSPTSLNPVSIQCRFLLCKPKSNNSRDSELV